MTLKGLVMAHSVCLFPALLLSHPYVRAARLTVMLGRPVVYECVIHGGSQKREEHNKIHRNVQVHNGLQMVRATPTPTHRHTHTHAMDRRGRWSTMLMSDRIVLISGRGQGSRVEGEKLRISYEPSHIHLSYKPGIRVNV